MLVSEVSLVEEWKERQIKSGRLAVDDVRAAGKLDSASKRGTHHTGRNRENGNNRRRQNHDANPFAATADPKDEYQRFGGNLSYCFTGAWDLSEHCRALIRRPNYWVEKATPAHATHPKCYESQRYLG